MRRIRHIAICILLLVPLTALAGEVIDGVIATVNRKPILQSDWDDAVGFEAFMQQKPLRSVSEADRVSALQRLIDRRLLEMQMSDADKLAPSRDEVRASVRRLREQIPAARDDQGWQRLLASYGFTERDIESNLRSEKLVMNFIEVRLRPSVHVQPEEVEAYYRTQLIPDMEKAGIRIVALKELEPKIRELLVQQHVDQLLDAWLHNLRQQSQVHSTIALPTLPASAGREAAGGN
ncbi:MAG TPA: SurA N-terminal domain-containing protein [Candidatus Eisenbacteria bacterium]|nr:SurA N-terminal domain-containing protein [Candidatus Eisenbacteria bacterium]